MEKEGEDEQEFENEVEAAEQEVEPA